MNELREGEDFYYEGRFVVFTAEYHLKRGYCCGSGCRHCPYDPKWTRGTGSIDEEAGDGRKAGSVGAARSVMP